MPENTCVHHKPGFPWLDFWAHWEWNQWVMIIWLFKHNQKSGIKILAFKMFTTNLQQSRPKPVTSVGPDPGQWPLWEQATDRDSHGNSSKPATSNTAGPIQQPPQDQAQASNLLWSRSGPATSMGADLSKLPWQDQAWTSDLYRSWPKQASSMGTGPNNFWEYRVTSRNTKGPPEWLEPWPWLQHEEQSSGPWIHWHLKEWLSEKWPQLHQSEE